MFSVGASSISIYLSLGYNAEAGQENTPNKELELIIKSSVQYLQESAMHLPPGQKAIQQFPRFGLPQYAKRFPTNTKTIELSISGDLNNKFSLSEELSELPRVKQISDFHCVTTWSKVQLHWEGVRFLDFYEQLIQPHINAPITCVVFKTQDDYQTSLTLEDLLADNVLLADKLDEKPLTIAHGAPLRLVAPNHYGYKNPKHLNRIAFLKEPLSNKSGLMKAIDHPRGRVAHEERANFAPGWLLRLPYRIGIKSTISDFQKALDKHLEGINE